jgi:membrane-bound ClpP family serine protease
VDFVTPIALILLGLVLIAVEVYAVPGVGGVGIAGGLAIVAGIVLGFVEGGALGGLMVSVGAVSVGGVMFYVMWQSGALQPFVLSEALRRDGDGAARESDARSRYLGRTGTAVTPLRPGGIVEVDGDRVEAQTEGGFIASGSSVRVVAMDRRRFFVRLADDAAVGLPPHAPALGTDAPP